LEHNKYLLYLENLQEALPGEVASQIDIKKLVMDQEIIDLVRNIFDRKALNSEGKFNYTLKQAYLTGIPIDERIVNDYIL
jgi:hypothetical protein